MFHMRNCEKTWFSLFAGGGCHNSDRWFWFVNLNYTKFWMKAQSHSYIKWIVIVLFGKEIRGKFRHNPTFPLHISASRRFERRDSVYYLREKIRLWVMIVPIERNREQLRELHRIVFPKKELVLVLMHNITRMWTKMISSYSFQMKVSFIS